MPRLPTPHTESAEAAVPLAEQAYRRLRQSIVKCEFAPGQGDDAWEAGVVAAAHGLALVEKRLGEQAPILDESWSGRHREFHLALYGGGTSPMLNNLVGVLFDNAERYRQFSARHRKLKRSKNAEHQQLMNAVLQRDADTALGLLRQHISGTERNVVETLLAIAPGTAQ